MGSNVTSAMKAFRVAAFLLPVLMLAAFVAPVNAQAVVNGKMVLDQASGWERYPWRPSVWPVNEFTWAMWYSGENDQGTSSIGVAYSSDGLSWTRYSGNPVLKPTAGAWDSGSVQEQWVVVENGVYKMWYTGETLDSSGNPTYVAIGYATSSDGSHWQKYAKNPVLAPAEAGAFDDDWVFRPAVVPQNPGYAMYYEGRSRSTGEIRIGTASSNDGITWVRGVQPISISQAPDGWSPYYMGGVYKIVDQWVMLLYGSRDSSQLPQIGFAKSVDGVSWTPYAANPIITVGAGGTWDDDGVILPTMFQLGNNYYIYYTGFQKGAGSRIGLTVYPTSSYPIPELPAPALTAAALLLASLGLVRLRRKK